MLQDRPYVIINVAQSINGIISGPNGKPVVISSSEDTRRVHNIRKMVDAVLVGANTVINDNPELKFNESLVGPGKQPMRVVLDSNLRIPESSRILDGSVDTVIFNAVKPGTYGRAKLIHFKRDDLSIPGILNALGNLGVKRILVEGGAKDSGGGRGQRNQRIHQFRYGGRIFHIHGKLHSSGEWGASFPV